MFKCIKLNIKLGAIKACFETALIILKSPM